MAQKRSHNIDVLDSVIGILVLILDDQDEEGNYVLGKKYVLEDFNHLTSGEMIRILVRLTKDIIPGILAPNPRIHKLKDFNAFGVGESIYDCEIDKVYNGIKGIFPPDSTVQLHYSTLLLPAKDPKATKAVLAAVLYFFMMSDTLYERFKSEFDDMIRASNEKAALYADNADLDEKIAETIQLRETGKERLPMMEKEVAIMQEKIRVEQVALARISNETTKLEGGYREKESELNALSEKLKELEAKRSHTETLLVKNAIELQNEKATWKKKLEDENAQRDEYGSQIRSYVENTTVHEKLIDEGNNVVKEFHIAIPLLEEVRSHQELLENGSDAAGNSTQMTRLKLDLKQLREKYEAAVKQRGFKEERHELKIRELNKISESLKCKSAEVRLAYKQERKKLLSFKDKMDKIKRLIDEVKVKITEHIRIRKLVIPIKKLELEKKAGKTLDAALGDFLLPPY